MWNGRGPEHSNYTSTIWIAGRCDSIKIFVWSKFAEQLTSDIAAWVCTIVEASCVARGFEKQKAAVLTGSEERVLGCRTGAIAATCVLSEHQASSATVGLALGREAHRRVLKVKACILLNLKD
jgi:hypothetical protein